MMIRKKKIKHAIVWNIAYMVLFFGCVLCIHILLGTSLPEVSRQRSVKQRSEVLQSCSGFDQKGLGVLGGIMLTFLPDDLAFTVFVPSELAFQSVLKLGANTSLAEENENNTYAIVSRVLGFSAVPQHLLSRDVLVRKEMILDSVSGFKLYIWKDLDGKIVVNNVKAECVDIRKQEIIVHVMNGVIMDADFEQSFSSE